MSSLQRHSLCRQYRRTWSFSRPSGSIATPITHIHFGCLLGYLMKRSMYTAVAVSWSILLPSQTGMQASTNSRCTSCISSAVTNLKRWPRCTGSCNRAEMRTLSCSLLLKECHLAIFRHCPSTNPANRCYNATQVSLAPCVQPATLDSLMHTS